MGSHILKCVSGTSAAGDTLVAIINKAMGYPKKSTHVGGGIHVVQPATWDGTGATPPGWTKNATANYVNTSLDAAVPISDALATALQQAGPRSLLSAGELTTLDAALLARADKDLTLAAYIPKASAVAAGAAVADDSQPQGIP